MRTLLAVVLLLALGAGPAASAERRIAIEEASFDPAVAIVAPGTEVIWKNADATTHRVVGDFAGSPPLATGAEFRHVFPRPGVYPYRDPDREAMEGTILVVGGGGGRSSWGPRPRGGHVIHRYNATLTLAMRESSRYRDGHWQSLEGPCNGQVGSTSRAVRFTVQLKDAKYELLPPFESFTTAKTPLRIALFRERVDSKAQNDQLGPPATCPNGTIESAPIHDVSCERKLDGKRMRIWFTWMPNVAQGRFQFSNDGPEPQPDLQCGLSYLNTAVLVGIEGNVLPLNLAGPYFLVDSGNTSQATGPEVRALRAGRALTIVREIRLRYTTECCSEWHSGQVPGIYVRVGEVREVFAKLTVRLTPR